MELDDVLPKHREDIRMHDFGEEKCVHDASAGLLHVLNGTAHLIWHLCDGRTTLRSALQEITSRFPNADSDRIVEDINSTIEQFCELGLCRAESRGPASSRHSP